MSDKDKSPRLSTLPPVTPADMSTVSRNLASLSTAITRMEGKIDTVKDDLLPPVAEAARQASYEVIRLNGRVNALESASPPPHTCVEGTRQARQDDDIGKLKTGSEATLSATKNTSKLLWWLIGVAATVGFAAVGFVLTERATATENSTMIRTHGSDLARHEREIDELEKARQSDRDLFIREVRALPTKVEQVAQRRTPTLEDVDDATDDLPLTNREREVMEKIIATARKRESQNLAR